MIWEIPPFEPTYVRNKTFVYKCPFSHIIRLSMYVHTNAHTELHNNIIVYGIVHDLISHSAARLNPPPSLPSLQRWVWGSQLQQALVCDQTRATVETNNC